MKPGIKGTSVFMGSRTRVTLAQAITPAAKKKPNTLWAFLLTPFRSLGARMIGWGKR